MCLRRVELQTTFKSKLSKYPSIEAFLSDAFSQRVKSEDWLENPLIQVILCRKLGNPDGINSLLNHADEHVLASIKKDLNGSDSEFDPKVWDSIVEVGASFYLKKQGCRNVEKLPRKSKKTADFKARCKQAVCYLEAKHLQSPSPVENLLWRKLTSRYLINPAVYSRPFYLDIDGGGAFEDKKCEDDDCEKCEMLLDKLEEHLCNGNCEEVSITYPKTLKNGSKINLCLKVDFCPLGEFSILLNSDRNIYNSSSPKEKLSQQAFKGKLQGKIEEAQCQLLSCDEKDAQKLIIYLCWDIPKRYVMLNPGFITEVRRCAGGHEKSLRQKDDRFRVVLHDWSKMLNIDN